MRQQIVYRYMTIVTEPLTWKINILPRSAVDVRHFTLRSKHLRFTNSNDSMRSRARYFSLVFSSSRARSLSLSFPLAATLAHNTASVTRFQSKHNKTPNAFGYLHSTSIALCSPTHAPSPLRQRNAAMSGWFSLCMLSVHSCRVRATFGSFGFSRSLLKHKFSECVWKSQNFSLVLIVSEHSW